MCSVPELPKAGGVFPADTCFRGSIVSPWRFSVSSSDLTPLAREAAAYGTQNAHKDDKVHTQARTHTHMNTHTHLLTCAVPVSSLHVASHQLPHTQNSLEMQRRHHKPVFLSFFLSLFYFFVLSFFYFFVLSFFLLLFHSFFSYASDNKQC